jgi:tetratricopeptide (TPR) repeat protein
MFRPKLAILIVLISLCAYSPAFAQTRSGKPTICEIQVHVTYENDRHAGLHLRVDLLNEQSVLMDQQFTDGEGRVSFHVSSDSPGGYRVRVSGADLEESFSDAITVNPGDRMTVAYVRLQQKQAAEAPADTKTKTAASTSANELRIPADAKRSFMKGMDALYRRDYPKAAEAFEKAVATYPQYDMAYDNLGMTYVMLAQPDKARAAFERAVQLNDKNADADRNYARLLLGSKENARAIELLTKALSVEPQDPSSLTLISIAQLRTGDVNAALQNALKVHDLSHEPHAAAHYVAGRAYEEKQEYQKATVEYETYLSESPDGPEAPQVRGALARVTASANPAPQAGAPPP